MVARGVIAGGEGPGYHGAHDVARKKIKGFDRRTAATWLKLIYPSWGPST